MAAVSPSVAWVAGSSSGASDAVVLKTVDGGATWVRQRVGAPVNLVAIAAASPSAAWAVGFAGVGGSAVVGTADGGATWRLEDVVSAEVLFAVAARPSRVWAAGQHGTILTSAGR